MRKLFFTFLTLSLSFTIVNAQGVIKCGTDFHNKELIELNPAAYQAAKALFDEQLKAYKVANPTDNKLGKTNEKFIIPVVFHVFHNNGGENLSDAQINSIMVKLNQYFNADPSFVGTVRPVFKDIIANTNFEFRLAKKDPQGNCTNGIVRIQTPLTTKATQQIKELSTWDTKKYLNIWTAQSVFSNGRAVGGFAQLPWSGLPRTDGLLVVASQSLNDNTVAHEIGHSLGLLHPFQGSNIDSCANGDEVDDTPPTYFLFAEGGSNTGRGVRCSNPNFNTCTNDNPDLPDMQENIMDYFENNSVFNCSGTMFSLGQYERMRFSLRAYRPQLWSPENLIATGVNDGYTCTPAPIAAFSTIPNTTRLCVGSTATFRDNTYNALANTYLWNFGAGASPATSTQQIPPNVSWTTSGWKTVTLTSTGPNGTSTKATENYVYVEGPSEYKSISTGVHNADWDYQKSFIQDGWTFENDNPVNWKITSFAKVNGNNSLMLESSTLTPSNSYSLVSPTFNLTGASNPYLSFSYSFAANYYSTTTTNDTRDGLRIEVSYDCGKTWQVRKTTQGSSQNEATPNPLTTTTPVQRSVYYLPVNANQWRNESIVGSSVGSGANLGSVRFKITFTFQGGNNFYIDNLALGVTSSLNEITAKDIRFSVMPNPFNTTSTVQYELSSNQQIVIKLYDVVGKEIATLTNEKQLAGKHELTIDRNQLGLKSGLYFIKTSVDLSGFSSKIMID